MRFFNDTYGYSNLVSQAGKRLMMTTAMTAVGLISVSNVANAQAATGPWDLNQDEGSFTKDFTTPNTNIITQLTDRAIGSGDANIDLNETVVIRQNNSGSLFVARDTKTDPTQILGNLRSNGRVMVIDDNGVFFGSDAVVNVGSIIATTASISNADIMDGNSTFEFTSGAKRVVENKGTITVAEGGLAAFVAPTVKNSGVINAVMGTVAMASGQTVTLDMYGDGLVEVAVDGELAKGLIKHTGRIDANGGNVIVSAKVAKDAVDNVINMNGVVNVASATVKGGKIILSGGSKGTVRVKKDLTASGAGQDAGSIEVTGQNVLIEGSADLKADSAGANAGDVIVRADDTLTLNGTISAQGLVDTGFVETSAPNTVFGPGASILATREWLLDPTDVTVDAPLAALVEGQLAVGDMTIQTPAGGAGEGDIDVDVVVSWATNNAFNLIAHDDVRINGTGGINATGAGSFSATGGGDIEVDGAITTQGGDVTFVAGTDGGQDDINIDDDINTNGGNFSATAGDDIRVRADLLTGGGDVTLTTLDNSYVAEVSVTAAGLVDSGNGNITINSDDVRITQVAGTYVDAGTGAVSINRVSNGTIGLGSAAGDTEIEQGELDSIAAATLNIGNPVAANSFTTDINVAGANMAGFTTVNLHALAASSINYFGVNSFATLNAFSDEITLGSGSSVNATNSIFFDAPIVNLDGNLNAPNISGTATIVNVNNNGNPVVVNEEIQDGVDVAAINAVVNVGAGTYAESVNVNKTLTLLGNNNGVSGGDAGRAAETTVTPSSPGFHVTADNVTIDGFEIVGADNGVLVDGAQNAKIKNNVIRNATSNGISFVANSDDGLIEGNKVVDSLTGIRVTGGSNNARIRKNIVEGSGFHGIVAGSLTKLIAQNEVTGSAQDGISVINSAGVEVRGNTVTDSGANGIKVLNSDGALVRGNTVDDTGDDGIDVDGSANTQIIANTVNNTDDDGIDLDGSINALIENNRIGLLGGADNIGDDGIDIENSAGATINNNRIQNTDENGIDVRGSDNTDITNNIIRFAGEDGVYVNPSDNIRILDNIITDVGDDGIRVNEGNDIRVRRNTIRRAGEDGIDITRNDFVRVTDNTVVDTKKRGISVERAKDETANYAVVVRDNTVRDTGRTAIVVDRFTTARIVDNTVRDSERAGIRAQRGDYVRLRRNDINDTKREGIKALGIDEVEVRRNQIRNARWDGILVDDFSFAWIGLNDVRNTGDDGIQASNGEYVAIYDNLIRKAGFFDDGIRADEVGADAIYVSHVGDGDAPVSITGATRLTPMSGRGFNVEVIGNDVHKTYDDGIEVVDSGSTWVSDNILTQIGYGVEDTGPENYGGGDHYGADAVHLRNVKGLPEGFRPGTIPGEISYNRRTLNGTQLREASLREATPDTVLFPEGAPFEYASVVINNQIRRTADDGVEIVGNDDKLSPVVTATSGDGMPTIEPTGRTVVAWNDIRHVGYGDISGDGDGGDGGDGSSYGYAPDGYGADAVHVRGIQGSRPHGDGGDGDGCGMPTAAPASIGMGDDFAVEVLENYIWNAGDDGVEVRDSGRTRVAANEIYNVGLATTEGTPPVWTSGWEHRGANDGDGVHIKHVHGGPFGNSVEVLDNIINHSGDDGVEVHYSGRTLVAGNTISNSGVGLGHPYGGGDEGYGHDGIHVGGVYADFDPYFGATNSVVIRDNVIDTTGDDGVEVHYAGRTLIIDNEISHAGYGGGVYYGYGDKDGADAINVMHVRSNDNNAPFSVDIRRNIIDVTADDGIEVAHSGRTRIRNNDLTNIGFDSFIPLTMSMMPIGINGADGIHVRDVNSNSERPRQMDVRIINNRITDAADDGIEVIGTDRVAVKRNVVDQAGDDGIVVLRRGPFAMPGLVSVQNDVQLRRRPVPSKAVIKGNVVTNSGTPFPDDMYEIKSIRRPGGDGIEVGGFDKIKVIGNDVSNSVENGLNVSGPHNGMVEVSGNTFTDNDIGAKFESGEIDLTGEGNIFDGGRVGMRFAPAEIYYYPQFSTFDDSPMSPMFADMSLVNNTIGAQRFDGQSENYVELDNGAFFNPGTPTLLNALDSTYVGTPFGTFTPSVDYAAGFPVDVVAYLESKFFHFNDDGSLGLFFFPLLPGINQEDIFNYFGPNADALSGLNVTILGLPTIPGGAPVALNDIAPAAGGGTSPEALNAIATAAGGEGEGASCWGDAANAAGSGQTVNLSYGGSAEELLNGEANCGS